MDPFELRRVELLHSSLDADKSRSSKQWYVLDAKICGGYVSKFLSSSPLVLNFLSEFTSVQRSELKKWREFGWPALSRLQSGNRLSVWSCLCRSATEI